MYASEEMMALLKENREMSPNEEMLNLLKEIQQEVHECKLILDSFVDALKLASENPMLSMFMPKL